MRVHGFETIMIPLYKGIDLTEQYIGLFQLNL